MVNGRGSALAVLAATLVLGLAAACAELDTTPEGDEPRRAVDPRTEALRFFPAGTEAVALTRVEDSDSMRRLDAAMSALATWGSQRERLGQALRAGGVDPEQVLALARTPGAGLDIPEPEIAAGAVPGSGPAGDRMLYVLATEQGLALDRMFSHAAEEGSLQPAGELDDARLYRVEGEELAFAVRDGVLICAVGVDRLQQAIQRRDGDREAQLDEAIVNELLNRLPEAEPFNAYLVVTEPVTALLDIFLEGLESETGEAIEAIELGLGASAVDTGLAIDVIVALDAAPAEAEDRPGATAEDPLVMPLTGDDLEARFGPSPAPALVEDIAGLEPLAAAFWIDGDRARIRIESGPAE